MNTPSLLNGMPYTPSHETDIRKTWARFGWKSLQEKPQHPAVHVGDDYDRVTRDDWLSAPGGFR